MPAFTKGKWIDCGDYTIGVEDENGYIKYYICECESVDFHITDEEVRANARLIAAAPDMYNFLVNLYGMIHIPGVKALLDRIDGKEDNSHETDA